MCSFPFVCEGAPKQFSKMVRLRFEPSACTFITPRSLCLLCIVGGNLESHSPPASLLFGVHYVPMFGKVGFVLGVNGVSIPGRTNA